MTNQTAAIMVNASITIVNVIQDLMMKTIQRIAQVSSVISCNFFDYLEGAALYLKTRLKTGL